MPSRSWSEHVELGLDIHDEPRTGGLVSAAERIGELEQVVAHLVAHLARTDRSILQQDIIRRYLDIRGADDVQALNRAQARLQPLGMLDCTRCGSKVRDLPGFTDERCIICGHRVGSQS